MYQAYFWDLDGTLYDTYPQMVNAFAQTLFHFQITPNKTTIYTIMRQTSLGKAFDYYAEQHNLNRSELEQIYYPLEQRLQKPKLFDGVRSILQLVVQNDGQNYLLTHRDRSAMKFIEHDGIRSLFTDFITSEQPFPRKPDPTSLNYLIDQHQVDRSKAVMVGDRNLDVQAGHNAGIDGILFDPDDLITITETPEHKIHTMQELRQY